MGKTFLPVVRSVSAATPCSWHRFPGKSAVAPPRRNRRPRSRRRAAAPGPCSGHRPAQPLPRPEARRAKGRRLGLVPLVGGGGGRAGGGGAARRAATGGRAAGLGDAGSGGPATAISEVDRAAGATGAM